jgi:hypothetical protein
MSRLLLSSFVQGVMRNGHGGLGVAAASGQVQAVVCAQ